MLKINYVIKRYLIQSEIFFIINKKKHGDLME